MPLAHAPLSTRARSSHLCLFLSLFLSVYTSAPTSVPLFFPVPTSSPASSLLPTPKQSPGPHRVSCETDARAIIFAIVHLLVAKSTLIRARVTRHRPRTTCLARVDSFFGLEALADILLFPIFPNREINGSEESSGCGSSNCLETFVLRFLCQSDLLFNVSSASDAVATPIRGVKCSFATA